MHSLFAKKTIWGLAGLILVGIFVYPSFTRLVAAQGEYRIFLPVVGFKIVTPTPTPKPLPTPLPTTQPPSAGDPIPAPSGYKWQITWNDEFNGTALDTTKWRMVNKTRSDDTTKTFYIPRNVAQSNGTLTLTVKKEDYCSGSTCTNYTGGMLESYDASSSDSSKYRLFRYGYYEARIKYHMIGCGFWANFWMYGRPTGPDEFDQEIMSCTGTNGTTDRSAQIRAAYHYSGGTSFQFYPGHYNDEWHTYGYFWMPGQPVKFYFDGKEVYSPGPISPTKFQYISLRAGVAHSLPTGGLISSNTQFPGTAVYDYVRVYTAVPK